MFTKKVITNMNITDKEIVYILYTGISLFEVAMPRKSGALFLHLVNSYAH